MVLNISLRLRLAIHLGGLVGARARVSISGYQEELERKGYPTQSGGLQVALEELQGAVLRV